MSPNVTYYLSDFGADREIQLYVEGIVGSRGQISITMGPFYNGQIGGVCGDAVNVSVLNVDLDSDLDNDGDIDEDDEPLEQQHIGEVIRVDDELDSTAGEDDLQYLSINVDEFTVDRGKVWFTYDQAHVELYEDFGEEDRIQSGGIGGHHWDLDSGDTVPKSRLCSRGFPEQGRRLGGNKKTSVSIGKSAASV